jgi:hypothetical protein
MTVLLEKAIKEMTALTEGRQDAVAQLILDAIQSDPYEHEEVDIDERAAVMITPEIKPLLDSIVTLMLDYAKSRNVVLLSTEVIGFAGPDYDSECLIILQTVDLDIDEAMRYWDDVCDHIQSYEETSLSPAEQRIARRRISTEIRGSSRANGI